jgi:hypothetical protein
MPKRSTRNKIRHQANQLLKDLDNCLLDLKYIDELAAGQSEIINQHLPIFVQFIVELQGSCSKFRDLL